MSVREYSCDTFSHQGRGEVKKAHPLSVKPAHSQFKSPAHAHGQGGALPAHVAIIMDGNGRWAKSKGLPRQLGHAKGVEAARRAVRFAREAGIGYLTLYAFSCENWRRPEDEISELLGLLRHFIASDVKELHSQNVRVRIIGETTNLTPDLLTLLENAQILTATNTGLTLVIAFNYGARQELVHATKVLAQRVASGEISIEDLSEAHISQSLYTSDIPDPDMIIRTSGEQRISNFLLWQSAYSELVYLDVLWPDFQANDFQSAIDLFNLRERRFGGI